MTLDDVPTEKVDVEGGEPEYVIKQGWAPLRSKDNLTSYGWITAETKILMAAYSGQCNNVINETENRHLNFLQCKEKVRKG